MPITHAIYLVTDTGEAIGFLRDTFGFEVNADEITITGDRFLTMSAAGSGGLHLQVIEMAQQPAISEHKRQAGVVDFIFETEDIEGMISRVEQQGLSIHRQPTRADYGWTAIFEDPFGNLWDLIQRH